MMHEGLAIFGSGLLLAGLWMAWPPASLIVGGLLLLGIALHQASNQDRK